MRRNHTANRTHRQGCDPKATQAQYVNLDGTSGHQPGTPGRDQNHRDLTRSMGRKPQQYESVTRTQNRSSGGHVPMEKGISTFRGTGPSHAGSLNRPYQMKLAPSGIEPH
jgi:hypothetical protein